MGKTDTVTKDYLQDTKVFADAFNLFIYGGEQVIDAGNLHEMDPSAIGVPYGKNGTVFPVQKYRDTLKYLAAMTDDSTAYLILGIESQSHTHYAMPVRADLYDTLEYAKQVEITARKHREDLKTQKNGKLTDDKIQHPTSDEYLSGFWKDDRLIPVITLVIYFSPEKWDGPLSLHEMFAIQDEKILSLVPDYRINFISPAAMSDEEIDKLQTSLREVMLYIKNSQDKAKLAKLVNADEKFKNLDKKAINVINSITNSRLSLKPGKEKEDCNMCKAIDDLCDEVAEDARVDSLINIMDSLGLSAEQAIKAAKIPDEEFEKYLTRLHLPEQPPRCYPLSQKR